MPIDLKIIRLKLCIEIMAYNQFHDTQKPNPQKNVIEKCKSVTAINPNICNINFSTKQKKTLKMHYENLSYCMIHFLYSIY